MYKYAVEQSGQQRHAAKAVLYMVGFKKQQDDAKTAVSLLQHTPFTTDVKAQKWVLNGDFHKRVRG